MSLGYSSLVIFRVKGHNMKKSLIYLNALLFCLLNLANAQTQIGHINGFELGMSVNEIIQKIKIIKPSFVDFSNQSSEELSDDFHVDEYGDTSDITVYETIAPDFYDAEYWTFYFNNKKCYDIIAYFPSSGSTKEFKKSDYLEIKSILDQKYGRSRTASKIDLGFSGINGVVWDIIDSKQKIKYQIKLILSKNSYETYSLEYINKSISDLVEEQEKIKIKKAKEERMKTKKSKF
jgi:hypothetical protein